MQERTVITFTTKGEKIIQRLPVAADGWAAIHPTSVAREHHTAQMAQRFRAYRASQQAGQSAA